MGKSISVVIPAYNCAAFIRDALASVCTQTLLPAEVIVVDDASTDNTCEVITEFARSSPVPIEIMRLAKNTGSPYGPANRAARRATGDYLIFLDSDDMFAPEAFETLVEAFESDNSGNVGTTVSDLLMFRDGTNEILVPSSFSRFPDVLGRVIADRSPVGVILERDEAVRATALGFAIPFRGLIARHVWEALGGFNVQYEHAADSEFTWRLVQQTSFRVRLVNRPLNRVRVWPGSMTSNRIRESNELIALYQTMIRELPDPVVRGELQRRLHREFFDLAYCAYKRRQFATLIRAVWGMLAAKTNMRIHRWRSNAVLSAVRV
jgi:glycosyltransferase involved in cell wall biosynthesis